MSGTGIPDSVRQKALRDAAAGGEGTTVDVSVESPSSSTPSPKKSSFIKRKIEVKFILARQGASFNNSSGGVPDAVRQKALRDAAAGGEGTTVDVSVESNPGSNSGDTVTLKGLRVQASINKAGGASLGEAQIRIFGMGFSLMNELSWIGLMLDEVPRNVIEIYAGDDQSGMGLVFVGTPTCAFADFQGAPAVCFNVVAHTGYFEAIQPAPVISYSGSVDVATLVQGIAAQTAFGFQNSGVNVKIPNPYLHGSPTDQFNQVKKTANIEGIMDGNVIAIWPKDGARGNQAPLVSPNTGMVGYPAYTSTGISLTSLYTPDIAFGSLVEVQSSLPAANGKWRVDTLDYNLESETPNGAWFLTAQCTRLGKASR